MTNLVAQFRAAVRENPSATAVSFGEVETPYADLWSLSGRFAGALRERGVGPGDTVAVYLPNVPQFVVALYGTLRVGGAVVPVDHRYRAEEIGHLLEDSTAGAVVTTTDKVPEIEAIHERTVLQFMVTADGPGQFSTGFAEFLSESPAVDFWSIASRDDDDVAAIAYTSGTTGRPKGVELTHGNLRSNAAAAAAVVPGGVDPDDGVLGAVPFSHVYGTTAAVNATLASGATVHPMATWDAGRAHELLQAGDVSVVHGTPAMYDDLLAHPDAGDADLSSVRFAGVLGHGSSAERLRRFAERFGVTVHEGYGLTEAAPVTHFNGPERGRRVGSVGRPVDGISARVVDADFEEVEPVVEGPVDDAVDLDAVVGEIVVAGPNVMRSYHGEPAATGAAFTDADGERWLHTGDVGYRDSEDYLYVVDRAADVVDVAGETVYPREVEDVLAGHDAAAECAVVGVPDARRGEAVKAFVVPAPGAAVTADELAAFCRERLPEPAQPRAFEFVDALPRTTAGTVRKVELREGVEGPVERMGLRDISGISESRAAALESAGYESVADLREATREELAGLEGFGDALATRIKNAVGDGREDATER